MSDWTYRYKVRPVRRSQGDDAMIGREFRTRLRLLRGSETITTRFELTDAGHLVEHISLETHDRRTGKRPDTRLVPVDRRKDPTTF